MASLVYPSDYNAGAPSVQFSNDEGGGSLFLPCPGNIAFSDSGNYSTIDLGAIGRSADAVKAGTSSAASFFGDRAGKSASENIKAAGRGIKNAGKSINNFLFDKQYRGDKLGLAGEIGAELFDAGTGLAAGGAFGDIAQQIAFDSTTDRKIFDPQTRTTFTGNSIRSFGFQFTLIARSRSDSDTIEAIHKFLREYSYPKRSTTRTNTILSYPPLWDIEFVNIKGVPKIQKCFLTELDTTFNPSNTIWMEDNRPIEVQISVNFTESRAMTREDIQASHKG